MAVFKFCCLSRVQTYLLTYLVIIVSMNLSLSVSFLHCTAVSSNYVDVQEFMLLNFRS